MCSSRLLGGEGEGGVDAWPKKQWPNVKNTPRHIYAKHDDPPGPPPPVFASPVLKTVPQSSKGSGDCFHGSNSRGLGGDGHSAPIAPLSAVGSRAGSDAATGAGVFYSTGTGAEKNKVVVVGMEEYADKEGENGVFGLGITNPEEFEGEHQSSRNSGVFLRLGDLVVILCRFCIFVFCVFFLLYLLVSLVLVLEYRSNNKLQSRGVQAGTQRPVVFFSRLFVSFDTSCVRTAVCDAALSKNVRVASWLRLAVTACPPPPNAHAHPCLEMPASVWKPDDTTGSVRSSKSNGNSFTPSVTPGKIKAALTPSFCRRSSSSETPPNTWSGQYQVQPIDDSGSFTPESNAAGSTFSRHDSVVSRHDSQLSHHSRNNSALSRNGDVVLGPSEPGPSS